MSIHLRESWAREAQTSSLKGPLDSLEAKIKAGDLEALIPWVIQAGRLEGAAQNPFNDGFHIWGLWDRLHPEWTLSEDHPLVEKLLQVATIPAVRMPTPATLRDYNRLIEMKDRLETLRNRMSSEFLTLRALSIYLQGENPRLLGISPEEWTDTQKSPSHLIHLWKELESIAREIRPLYHRTEDLYAQWKVSRR